jgi:hypothetical protein
VGDPIEAFTKDQRDLLTQVTAIGTDEARAQLSALEFVTGRSLHPSLLAAVRSVRSPGGLAMDVKGAEQLQQQE